MAYIHSFSVEGLAGRVEAYSKTLHPDISVLFGLNGSGKTSLLKILHSALSGKTRVLRAVPFVRATVRIMTAQGGLITRSIDHTPTPRQMDLSSPLVLRLSARTARHAENELEWQTSPQELAPRVGWAHTYLPTTRLFGVRERYQSEEADEAELDQTFAAQLATTWTKYRNDMLQDVRAAQEQGLTALVYEVIKPTEAVKDATDEPALGAEEGYELVNSFLQRQPRYRKQPLGSFSDFESRYFHDQQLRNVVRHLSTVELRIQQAMAPRSKLEELLNHLFTNKTVVTEDDKIVVKAGDMSIPVASLSSGEKHALRLFIEAVNQHRNPVIIDEPELSLHVDWQRELVYSMRALKPESQLIVATHSPEVMVGIDDENIFRI